MNRCPATATSASSPRRPGCKCTPLAALIPLYQHLGCQGDPPTPPSCISPALGISEPSLGGFGRRVFPLTPGGSVLVVLVPGGSGHLLLRRLLVVAGMLVLLPTVLCRALYALGSAAIQTWPLFLLVGGLVGGVPPPAADFAPPDRRSGVLGGDVLSQHATYFPVGGAGVGALLEPQPCLFRSALGVGVFLPRFLRLPRGLVGVGVLPLLSAVPARDPANQINSCGSYAFSWAWGAPIASTGGCLLTTSSAVSAPPSRSPGCRGPFVAAVSAHVQGRRSRGPTPVTCGLPSRWPE